MPVPMFKTGVKDGKGREIYFFAGNVKGLSVIPNFGQPRKPSPRVFTRGELGKFQKAYDKYHKAHTVIKKGKFVVVLK